MAEPRPATGSLVLDADALLAAHRVGPDAFLVLLELYHLAHTDRDGRLVASASLRGLQGRIGLSKDTVARCLVALRAAGFIERTVTGRSPSSYLLHPDRAHIRRLPDPATHR